MSIKRGKKEALKFVFYSSAILAIDQFTKSLVYSTLTVGQTIPVLKNIFHITFVRNTGAAFGLFKQGTHVFIGISIIAIIFIAGLILKAIRTGEFSARPLYSLSLTMIASGAMGNLIDRLRFGYVVDFIDVRVWPVFNFADTFITIGTCLLIISLLKNQAHN
ncbi:MAG: signal peptidase II [Candidatus Omnitrophota bacterium]|jgi:signal peptidase II|nr:signal peptidase II [Candidatus Omnitrophota bacterium]